MSRATLGFNLIGGVYAIVIGWHIHQRQWAAAAALFTYGLALALGLIWQEVRKGNSK